MLYAAIKLWPVLLWECSLFSAPAMAAVVSELPPDRAWDCQLYPIEHRLTGSGPGAFSAPSAQRSSVPARRAPRWNILTLISDCKRRIQGLFASGRVSYRVLDPTHHLLMNHVVHFRAFSRTQHQYLRFRQGCQTNGSVPCPGRSIPWSVSTAHKAEKLHPISPISISLLSLSPPSCC